MNKVKKFDKEQKIHSCSPFAIAYNFNFSDKDKQSHGIKIFKKKDKPTKDEIKENHLDNEHNIGFLNFLL